jgi:dTDP-4-amino-4,6-dideoxygalactose transaminase
VVSFGAGKVGAAGAGGAVLSDDLDLLAHVRSFLDDGPAREQKMAEIAPRVMDALDGLKDEVEERLRRASDYRNPLRQDGITHVGEVLPVWKYSVLLRDRVERDRVTRQLLAKGIAATNLYPPLVHWFAGVDGETYDGAKGLHERIVNLPLWDEGNTPSTGSADDVFEQILDINKMKEDKR